VWSGLRRGIDYNRIAVAKSCILRNSPLIAIPLKDTTSERPDMGTISVHARKTDKEKKDHYKQIETILTLKEPEVSTLADQLWTAIRTRVNLWSKPNNTTKVFLDKKEASPTDVLDILLQLHVEAPLLLNKTLPEILNTIGIVGENPLSYCGIYVGGFVSDEGGMYTAMSLRDAIRIASICSRRHRIKNALHPLTANPTTTTAAVSMASIWIATLRDMDMWEEAHEFEAKMSGDSPLPRFLTAPKYNVGFPWSPLYVGYSQDVEHRLLQHQSCTRP